MKHAMCRGLAVIAIVISILTCFAIVLSYMWTPAAPTEISGFSPELIESLNTKYQISIPENAKFIKGIYTNAFRDPGIVIMFEFPNDDLNFLTADLQDVIDCLYRTLNLDGSIYGYGGVDQEMKVDWYDDFGGSLDYIIENKNDPHTVISFSLSKDTFLVRFVGRHPDYV